MEALNRGRPDQIQHVDAWDGHPFYPTPEGFVDETFDFAFPLTVATSQMAVDRPLRVDADADFLLRSLLGEFVGGAGISDIRLTDPSGSYMSNDFIIFDLLVQTPGSNELSPVFPEVRVPANGLMLADLLETSGAGPSTVLLVFLGVKRRRRAARKCDFPPASEVNRG